MLARVTTDLECRSAHERPAMSEPLPSREKGLILSRCPACQLQLCKGRSEPPHAALKDVGAGGAMAGSDKHFTCQSCGITLVNSSDLATPGWRHHRQ